MSVRPLGDDGGSDKESTIRNVAETQGIESDIEAIESERDRTSDGDTVVYYRVYTDAVYNDDGSVDEVNSVGAQITDFPDKDVGPNVFRDSVQNTLRKLKQSIRGEQNSPPDESEDELEKLAQQDTRSGTTMAEDGETDSIQPEPDLTAVTQESDSETTPGALIDQQLAEYERRISELEDRFDELEDGIEALEALQQLTDQ